MELHRIKWKEKKKLKHGKQPPLFYLFFGFNMVLILCLFDLFVEYICRTPSAEVECHTQHSFHFDVCMRKGVCFLYITLLQACYKYGI